MEELSLHWCHNSGRLVGIVLGCLRDLDHTHRRWILRSNVPRDFFSRILCRAGSVASKPIWQRNPEMACMLSVCSC